MNDNTLNIAPFGHWQSDISTEMLAAKSNRLGQMKVIGNSVYWLESRAQDKGRGVIVKYCNGKTVDITPEGYSVKTRVHEYGSGDFWGAKGKIIFANDKDQRLYLQNLVSETVRPLTQESETKLGLRYADGDLSDLHNFTVCVREFHPKDSNAHQVINDLISCHIETGEVKVIANGADFYSNPRISPDGKRICWLQWSHPNMPWDETELWQADIYSDGDVGNPLKVAGGDQTSIYNPQWTDDNQLIYVSDSNGWWHIYLNGELSHDFDEIEFGFPQWQFGCNSFQLIDNKLYAIGTKKGEQNLYKIDLETSEVELLEKRFCYFNGQLTKVDEQLFFMAASKVKSLSIYLLDSKTNEISPLVPAKNSFQFQSISQGQHLTFSTTKDAKAHGFFYPPANDDYQNPTNELPPLIVMSHGGPTGMTDAGFNLQVQFWTNRGFAVADVNYRGSTGYGRKFRDSLKGQWGIYDVDDCIAMAQHLVQEGKVDINRLAIRGGSAGGYTTLCALTFHDKFKVGMSRYGVADLLSLAQDSHKFEIRYLDTVVGPLPESEKLYLERSPSEHTDKLSCPILLLQGLEDKVVPPSQSEAMVKALEAKGLAYEYIEFEGEGHGFRKPATIIKAFEAELEFYKKYLL
ncbi:S9 family peptidase [Kangiella sp. HZ709]|uniref:S9 family peptidase n=1 Tax=Kangiella sp. HZ709 TaxID=2666328 RepID=UPI0012B0ADDA|nr:S9 family peptidase [Kangiella sp. HZ709]MRX28460.1 prolyl oligopeptidase family serine peptidase [Kangiella sp. HZ709]